LVNLLTKFQSYITAAITASATSLVLKSVTDIPAVSFMAILGAGTEDEEAVLVTAINTTTKELTITRAQRGSTAVAHAKNSLFYHSEIELTDLASNKSYSSPGNGLFLDLEYTGRELAAFKAMRCDLTYKPATSGCAVPIAIAGKIILDGNFTGGAGYCWGIQAQMHFADGCIINDEGACFVALRAVLTEDSKDGWTSTDGWLAALRVESLLQTNVTTASNPKALQQIGNWGGSSNFCTFDGVFMVYGRYCENLFWFYDCDADDSFITAETSDPVGEWTHKIKVHLNNGNLTRYIMLCTDPTG